MTPPRLDIAGQRYGWLTAIKYEGRKSVGHKGQFESIWLFRCDCGALVIRSLNRVRMGETSSCGCFSKSKSAKRYRLPDGESSFNGLYSHYGRAAKSRGYSWELTQDQFRDLTKQCCHYCGSGPSQQFTSNAQSNGAYTYSGVDRIDNTIGYRVDNCVPCCKVCNFAKRDMSTEEFTVWVSRVYEHMRVYR